MDMYAPVWFLLMAIAVVDVRERRIPNKLLLLSTLIILIIALMFYSSPMDYAYTLAGGIALFSVGFILFLVKAMSPGDVKLLFVVGAFVGWGDLTEACLYITLAGGLVGLFYLLYNTSLNNEGLFTMSKSYIFNRFLWMQGIKPKVEAVGVCHSRYSSKLTMPFAPSVVIGLAMFSYFQ